MRRRTCLALLLAVASPLAANEPSKAGPLARLSIEPDALVLVGAGARQQLLVTGHYRDGSVRDLTHVAEWRCDRADLLRLQEGIVCSLADGTAQLVAQVENQQATIKIEVRDATKTTPVSFRNDVMAVLSRAGCNLGTCHGNFNGKNGFRLSLRGENPDFDLDSMVRDTQGRRTCVFDPERSLILQKPTGQTPHEGGIRFRKNSVEYSLLERWIRAGAKPDADTTPRLTKLDVFPRERVLLHGAAEQQLVTRAAFSDGSVRDVTHMTVFEPTVETVHVSAGGLVRADKPCEVTVVARYLDRRVPVRLAFVPDRPDFRWPAVAAHNVIDRHVFARLKALHVEPSDLADDAMFLRRAYLDVCGILPTPDEAKRFLTDPRPDKRRRLIDQLLERPEYADYWSMKWADLLRNEEKAVDAKGVRLFQRWLRQCVSDDMPLDSFVRRLLTARGSTYDRPEANYYRTNLDPQKAAETTAQLFLGVRVACAKCHNHPFDRWTQEDYHGLSAFFARVRTRMIDNQRRDRLDKHELVGEMIVWHDREGDVPHPQQGGTIAPRLPGAAASHVSDGADRLTALADWITRADNPFFARVMANRIWHHLLGRGVVEPVDDFRESNPASNEPLLDALAKELIASGWRQKPLIRTIMASRAYQASSRAKPTNEEDLNFSHVEPRMLQAEALLDAISQVTEVPERFASHPLGTRAAQLPGVSGAPNFLKSFGRPDRLLACECERQATTTLNQALQMINSESITRKVIESPRVERWLANKSSNEAVIAELYLAALSRFPTARERDAIASRLERAPERRAALEDLLWAMINTKEFLLRR